MTEQTYSAVSRAVLASVLVMGFGGIAANIHHIAVIDTRLEFIIEQIKQLRDVDQAFDEHGSRQVQLLQQIIKERAERDKVVQERLQANEVLMTEIVKLLHKPPSATPRRSD